MTTKIYLGNCLDVLKRLPANSVHCCVTSPPYFGLRDYGVVGQLGLEESPDAFVTALVRVFREVRRVLRDDGTLWLNLGDSYAANRPYQVPSTKSGKKHSTAQGVQGRGSRAPYGLKPKDLIGIPWRVALALQADGWYLRQDIIWHKPNPMPESVRDRCTKAHEYIFMLSKSKNYYYDADAIREPFTSAYTLDVMSKRTETTVKIGNNFNKALRYTQGVQTPRTRAERAALINPLGKNKRSVWTVKPESFKGAHFATFPPALIEPCILAGSPVRGVILDPFFGSGTTGLVSNRTARHAVGIELNAEYARIAVNRLRPTHRKLIVQTSRRKLVYTNAGPFG